MNPLLINKKRAFSIFSQPLNPLLFAVNMNYS